ncbi:MAG: glycosyltransferase family 39 protein [Chloroflexi bacterium]|nr:glycosyltransferase family 39 protein [Chloroflexota bacterium]
MNEAPGSLTAGVSRPAPRGLRAADFLKRLDAQNQTAVVLLCMAVYAVEWLIAYIVHDVPFASLETDGMYYIQVAQSLFTNHLLLDGWHGLGYPLAIWLAEHAVGDWFRSAQIVSGLSGAAFIVATYWVVARLMGTRVALLTVVLLLTNLWVLMDSVLALSDMLAVALAMVSLGLVCSDAESRRNVIIAGVLGGLAFSARYVYVALLLVPFVLVLLHWNSDGKKLCEALLYFLGFGLAVSPVLWANYSLFGTPLYTETFKNIAAALYGWDHAAEFDSMMAVVQRNPLLFAATLVKRIGFDMPAYLIHVVYYVILFSVPGLVLFFAERENRNAKALWGVILASYVVLAALGWNELEERYFLFLIPWLVAGAGYLIVRLFQDRNWMVYGLSGVLVVVNLAGIGENLPSIAAEQAPEFQRAGAAIQAHTSASDLLLVSQPQIAYQAQRPYVLMLGQPISTAADLGPLVDRLHIQYVVMDDRYGGNHYPGLSFLFDTDQVASMLPGWRLLYQGPGPWRIVVWQVAPASGEAN